MTGHRMQKTIKRDVFLSGIGLFTGEKVSVRLMKVPAGSGIVFQRVDLPKQPIIPANLNFASSTMRCTKLATKTASVITVEHLLSALHALEIDNVHIEIKGPEVPAGDGSAQPFVKLIEQAGVIEQDEPKKYMSLSHSVYWSEKETHLIALPDERFRISYTLHYPQSSLIQSQYMSLAIDPDSYASEIAPCRTFSLYEEIAPLIERGLLKGGGLENALVIQDNRVLNPEGTRFANEMVRHKILDLIGDLSLLGCSLQAHIIAIRSGHHSNIAFANTLRNYLKSNWLESRSPNEYEAAMVEGLQMRLQ